MTRARLKVREIAESKGISRTRLHHDSEVAYATITRLATALGVQTVDLIEDVSDEQYEAELAQIKATKKRGR